MDAQEFKELRSDVTDIKVMQASMQVTLEKNTESLDKHMLRTELNEARIHTLENASSFARGAIWAIGGATVAITALLGLYYQFVQ